ncbi:bifunctional phosphoribosyl-AMP cyclohydrolase/phosphoribosyl-ATP diphosphatase HisIE [Legionella cardiaca]|uniref:Histidine biosynthesis bifunctional protein HisIE n=1 Tax=Legionella cardiaca TaxID=1071983 RepID=A0ABY8AXS0_9GAMM|nr:bifunctional phosphoribosyl-AMP cyclohydrolase/phosphoribosyl-ATP diphosphatase HisIE [Legionella cardiaca]WED44544.1 bifunctional phosphoribosyl-AMP cyclohydrolase/phosphoribosyl-ATP diphosphatase HisIE [Legionella cardiaca]
MNSNDINKLDWQKMKGLLPAIVQDSNTGSVLMLGYMNEEALVVSLETKQLTFFSRSKQRLWRKGETSGNTMTVESITADCDGDSLLIQVQPAGAACHLGFNTCFQPASGLKLTFLADLIEIINERANSQSTTSYTSQLLAAGINRCAQKVGEEAVETVIAAVSKNREELINESADLLFHLLVLLKISEVGFYDLLGCLRERHQK